MCARAMHLQHATSAVPNLTTVPAQPSEQQQAHPYNTSPPLSVHQFSEDFDPLLELSPNHPASCQHLERLYHQDKQPLTAQQLHHQGHQGHSLYHQHLYRHQTQSSPYPTPPPSLTAQSHSSESRQASCPADQDSFVAEVRSATASDLSSLSSKALIGPSQTAVVSNTSMASSAASPGSSTSAAAIVRRACDQCHRRKVKCIGESTKTCKNCSQAGLKCTYLSVPQKKGPKGSRAKVISELRETQRKHDATRSSHFFMGSPPGSPMFPLPPTILPQDLIDTCTEYFFSHVYPTQPILHRDLLQQSVMNMHQSPEDYCLITALCAYMLIQPNIALPSGLSLEPSSPPVDAISNEGLGIKLLADALEVRKVCHHFENPGVTSVITSFFFFGCYFCLEKHNTAWFHLREATTLAILAEMHQEETYIGRDPVEGLLRRRLYWLLFVTERAYALQTQKPLTLHATIESPHIEDDPAQATALTGFNHLIRLFRPFDDTFIGLWNQSIQGCNAEWIQLLQQQLSEALPKYLDSTETQAVDLKVSQHWLRVMIWQLSISQRLLSSNASDSSLTFRFPIELSREFVTETSRFSQEAMEVHGIGLVKKIFDVACTLIDVMTCVPMDQSGFEVGPRDYLNHLMLLVSKLRGGQQRYLPLLLSKADALQRIPGNTLNPDGPSLDAYFEEGSESSGATASNVQSGQVYDQIEDITDQSEFSDLMDQSDYPAQAATGQSPFHGSSPASTFSHQGNAQQR